ncbi:hypothetical protein GQX74_004165 [Glossina fuscipes]|nr:hypothetical protein GQX74_004165 [Glossina fuscipes]
MDRRNIESDTKSIALTRFSSSSACSFASSASCFNFLMSISGAVRPFTSANSVRAVSTMANTYSLQRLPSTLSLQRQMPVSVSQEGTFSNEPLESQPQEYFKIKFKPCSERYLLISASHTILDLQISTKEDGSKKYDFTYIN